jgi:hypothetical protein
VCAGLVLSVCLALAAGGAGESGASGANARAGAPGPFLLVSLGSLGTVTWRCEGRTGWYALGFRLSGRRATTLVTLRAGGSAHGRVTVQPGERVAFPYLADDVQRLVIVQGTGARTIRADVTVTFDPDASYTFCHAYLPPSLHVGMRRVG